MMYGFVEHDWSKEKNEKNWSQTAAVQDQSYFTPDLVVPDGWECILYLLAKPKRGQPYDVLDSCGGLKMFGGIACTELLALLVPWISIVPVLEGVVLRIIDPQPVSPVTRRVQLGYDLAWTVCHSSQSQPHQHKHPPACRCRARGVVPGAPFFMLGAQGRAALVVQACHKGLKSCQLHCTFCWKHAHPIFAATSVRWRAAPCILTGSRVQNRIAYLILSLTQANVLLRMLSSSNVELAQCVCNESLSPKPDIIRFQLLNGNQARL